MENDLDKQKVAKMFLNMLTDPNRASELFESTNRSTPRKNPNFNNVNDEITKAVLMGVKDSQYNVPYIYDKKDNDIDFAFNYFFSLFTPSTTYEDAIDFLKQWIVRSYDETLLVPKDPS